MGSHLTGKSVGICEPLLAHIYAVFNALEKVRAILVNLRDWKLGTCDCMSSNAL